MVFCKARHSNPSPTAEETWNPPFRILPLYIVVKCAGDGLACLRGVSAEVLEHANVKLNKGGLPGTFAVGPSAGGSWVRQFPAIELDEGNFLPLMKGDEDFTTTIQSTYSAYAKRAGITSSIFNRYGKSNYSSAFERFKAYPDDSSLYCLHGMDLLPAFSNLDLNLDGFGRSVPFSLVPGLGGFLQAYQSYFVSHARTAEPNTHRKKWGLSPTVAWPKSDGNGDKVQGTLQAGNLGFSVISDGQVRRETSDF
ncbi:MAG: hypothetical protein Q9180_001971 [Flavoplaca navasiana]